VEQKTVTRRVQVHAHIEPVVRAELLIIANANDRSLAGEIRQAIREHVEREATAAEPVGDPERGEECEPESDSE
jgi:predicted transcriptional regulator